MQRILAAGDVDESKRRTIREDTPSLYCRDDGIFHEWKYVV